MKIPFPAVLLLAAAFTLPSVGCKRLAERAAEKAEEKAIEKGTGGQVSINGQKGTMTIVTDAGAVTMGETAKIPDDFPKNVPVYPGATPKVAVKSAQGGKDTWSVVLETTDSKDKVVAYYKANLSGFTQASSMDVGTGFMQVYQSPKMDVSLVVGSESGGKQSITLSVTTK